MRILKRIYRAGILGLLLMLTAPPLRASTFRWTGADNLNQVWNDPRNWITVAGVGSFPNAPDDVAEFVGNPVISSLTVGVPITVGEIDFGSTRSFTISPGAFGSLTFASTSNAPLVINAGADGFTNTGADTISAPIIIGSGQEQVPPNLQIVTGGGSLTLSGGVSGQGGLNASILTGSSLLVAKPGDAAYGASYTGPTYVQSGVLEVHNVLLSNTITVVNSVDNNATLKLAGSNSALSSGANRVNIVNNSTAAAGILVSGTHQQVGNIDGSGTTQVNAGSDLTANHIIQKALVIGGTAGSNGLVTIDASDSSGNPLAQSNGLALAGSIQPSEPFSAGASTTSILLPPSAEGFSGDPNPGGGAPTGNLSAVPEPSTVLLFAFALAGLLLYPCCARRPVG